MYLPPQFDAKDRSHALTLMREHPFASLISTDEQGLPFVTHLPLKAEEGEGEGGALTLLGHVARGNPHARYLQQRPRAVATFLGGHAYMSPSVYPDLQRVPTWNYVAVHCTVEARLIEDAQAKDALLKKLIAEHEPSYAAQWRSLSEDYAQKMLSAIVAFELRVTELQCKLKLNQHRPEAHAAMHAGYITGSESERELATWMERLGLHAR